MRRSDEADFIAFVSVHRRGLRRSAYLLCADWQRADDAVQDALVKLYAAWTRLDRGAGLRSYAQRAIVNISP